MLNGILVALLTVLQPSTPVQPELQGQPCTAQALVGTWQYGGKITSPGVTSVLKHVTPTHFFVVRIGPNDVVHSAHGGPYTLADDTYSETITHGFGGVFEMLRARYRLVPVPNQR